MNPIAKQFIRPTCLCVFSLCLLNTPDARAANTIDPNSTGATDVVADPFGSPVLLANPLADPLNLPGDTLAIGNTAAGELLIDAGSSVTTFRGEVGVSNGSTGSVAVSGSGSTWTSTDSMNVGRSGSGTLDVDSGATVTSQNDLTVGNIGGSSGAISVDNASLSVTDQFTVGRLGEGDATFQNNSQLSARRVIVGFDNEFAIGTPSLEVLSGSDMQVTGGGADLFAIAQADNSRGELTIDGTGSTLTSSLELKVGILGDGSFNVRNGGVADFTANGLQIAEGVGSTGSATVTGSGSVINASGDFYVGNAGTGTLNVEAGATTTISGFMEVGSASFSEGTILIDGVGSVVETGSYIYVGRSSEGTIDIKNGGVLRSTASSLRIAQNGNASKGTVTLTEDSRLENAAAPLSVGVQGNGTLSIADTATVVAGGNLILGRDDGSVGTITQSGGTISVAGDGIIGQNTGSTGTAIVTGVGSTWTNAGFLYVGKSGTGTLNVQNGGSLSTGSARLGNDPNSSGQATISDPNSTWTNTGDFIVGNAGMGTLIIENGGSLSNGVGYLGFNSPSSGTATVRGTDPNGNASTWTNSDSLIVGGTLVGSEGTATLNVANSGTVISGNLLKLWDTGTINLDGGAIQTRSFDNSDGGTLNHTDGTLIVDGGTFTPDPNAYTIDDPNGTPVVRLINGASGSIAGELNVGLAGNGEFHIESGSQFSNDDAYIGRNAGLIGVVSISGTDPNGVGSVWTNTGSLFVGDGGKGTLDILDGGSVSNSSSGVVGGDPNSVGVVTVSGSGSSWDSGSHTIGEEGAGSLHILDGASATSSIGYIGSASGSTGDVTVNGTGSHWSYVSDVLIGSRGNGSLLIQNGASVQSLGFNSRGYIAYDPNSTGSVTVSDPNSVWANSGDLYVGTQGEGQLSVTEGAAVSNNNGSIGWAPGSIGEASVSGIGSTWTNSGQLVVGWQGGGQLFVTAGAAVSNTTGYIGLDPGVTGEVSVSGPGSTWTNSGTLFVGGTGNGVLGVSAGGSVSSFLMFIGSSTGSEGTATIEGTGTTWSIGSNAFIGNSGNGTLTISEGAEVSNGMGYVGNGPTASGIVTVEDDGSTWANAGGLYIGYSGNGTLQILDGGTVSSASSSYVGFNNSSSGSMTIAGIGSSFDSNGNFLVVGQQGQGSVVVRNGGSVDVGPLLLGATSASTTSGTFIVEGAGSTVSVSGQAYVGGDILSAKGVGRLSVMNGGVFTATDLLTVWNTGQLNMAGGTINVDRLRFQDSTLTGHGTINVTGYTDGDVAVTATGGTLTLNLNPTDSGNEFVPNSLVTNTGTLELVDPNANSFPLGQTTALEGGALLVRNGAELEIGDTLSGYGIIVGNVTGPGYNQIASFPTGIVDFRGTLDVGADTATIYSSQQPTINGRITFAGGSLSTTASNLLVGSSGIIKGYADLTGINYMGAAGSVARASDGTLSLGNSSAVNGFYSNGTLEVDDGATLVLLDWNDAVLESGSLVTLGNGSTLQADSGLTLDFGGNITGHGTVATPNNPATPFVNNGNTIGDDPNAPITLSGYVKGVGTLDNVVITGTDAPGFSPATVNRGSVIYDGVLEIELGGSTVGSFDQLNHFLGAGIADLGGTLNVTLIDGYEPSDGDSFEIIAASSILDTFDIESLPALDAGLEWLVEYLPTSVLLSVSAGLPGDFDENGRVDGFDFLAWQRDTNLGSLADWEANYGTPTTANATAVPEPSALWLALVATVWPARRRF